MDRLEAETGAYEPIILGEGAVVKLDLEDPTVRASLVGGLSKGRFERFLRDAGEDEVEALRLYLWNTAIAAAFYAPLQTLEVALRDAIHRELSADHGDRWWERWDINLDWRALQQIDTAATRLRSRKQPVTPAGLVAALTFGFWVKLLGPGLRGIYEEHFWRQSLYRAFPFAKRDRSLKSFTRVEVFKPISATNEFRNRVAHHVPIYREPLTDQFATIQTICGWIAPSARTMVDAFDTCTPLLGLISADVSTNTYRVAETFPAHF
jgi:hypothetical protein